MASGAGEYPPLPGRLRHRHGGSGGCVSGVAQMVPEGASGIRPRPRGHPVAAPIDASQLQSEPRPLGSACWHSVDFWARLGPGTSPSARRVRFGVVPPKLTTEDREKRSAALSSLVAAVGLTAMKTIVGLLPGSLGILAEAAHSGLDLVAALMTYIAVRISGRPADRTHLYGHGKVENLSALLETLLLFVTCGWIIQEALHRLFFHKVEV